MSTEKFTPQEAVRFEAASHLRETDNIRSALLEIKKDPEGFNERVAEFDKVTNSLNDLFRVKEIDKGFHGNVEDLKQLVSEDENIQNIPTVSQLTRIQDGRIPYQTIEVTFEEIDGMIKSGEWEFPNQITDPGQLTSGLLIEGYGLLLEKHYGKKGLARKFVLAFEEVLFTNFKDSKILSDILPWMEEEKADFSPEIRKKLEEKKEKND